MNIARYKYYWATFETMTIIVIEPQLRPWPVFISNGADFENELLYCDVVIVLFLNCSVTKNLQN